MMAGLPFHGKQLNPEWVPEDRASAIGRRGVELAVREGAEKPRRDLLFLWRSDA